MIDRVQEQRTKREIVKFRVRGKNKKDKRGKKHLTNDRDSSRFEILRIIQVEKDSRMEQKDKLKGKKRVIIGDLECESKSLKIEILRGDEAISKTRVGFDDVEVTLFDVLR